MAGRRHNAHGAETVTETVPTAEDVRETVETAHEAEAAEAAEATETGESTEEAPKFVSVWDQLPEPEEDSAYVRGPVRADVEKETPEPIKKWLMMSLEENTREAEEAAKAGRKAKVKFRVQTFPNEMNAEAFVKIAKKYARGREERFTFRGGQMPQALNRVRFAAKPFEARERQQ